MSQNPALRQWWEKEQSGRAQNMDQVVETIRQFGSYLGDEIAVSVSMDGKGEPGEPLVLAELKNSQGFRQFLEQEIAKYSSDKKGRPRNRVYRESGCPQLRSLVTARKSCTSGFRTTCLPPVRSCSSFRVSRQPLATET